MKYLVGRDRGTLLTLHTGQALAELMLQGATRAPRVIRLRTGLRETLTS